jgi:F-type H+-transporting ATPase subunit a
MLLFLYPLEILSHFLRLLSLAIRLWANLLAGHLLIDFMAGDMAVLLGLPPWAGSPCLSGSRSTCSSAF